MAELVEMRMEQSMIEYEQMRTLKLFDEVEIKDLIRKRTDFEHKLRKSQKIFKDILEYIRFERNLLKLVKERQRTRKTELNLEVSIVKKVQKLYGLATSRFPNDERVWEEYIFFCNGVPSIQAEVRQILMRMVQFHGNNPVAWLKSIKWEREHSEAQVKDANVRQLVLQGIQRHPTNVQLCVELMNVILTSEVAEEIRMESVLRAYASCSEGCAGIEYHLAVLEESMQHEWAHDFQRRVLDDMKQLYATNPLFWQAIAQRELSGLPTYRAPAEKPVTMRERIVNCIEVYENAITELDTIEMWSMYLDAVIEMNRDLNVRQLPLRRRMLAQVFNKADTMGRMSVQHYTTYVNILYAANAPDETVESILKRAIKLHHDSTDMWKIYIQHYMRDEQLDKVLAAFSESRKRLPNATASIWQDHIEFLRGLSDQNKLVKAAYEEALLQLSHDFDRLKCDYVDWTYSVGGMQWTRRLFQRACQLGKATMGMARRMNELEESQLVPNREEWRKNIELAVQHFGKTDPDIWLMLIQFEKQHGDPINVSRVTKNAQVTLKPDQYRVFLSKSS